MTMTPEAFLDALMQIPGLVNPIVSPNGRWVAWTWFRVGPAADVFMAPTDGSRPPTRLTETPENTFVVSWTPDSAAVIVEEDKGGNERAQLFRVDVKRPGVMVPLTEPDPHYYVRGGQLHPNGRWLVYGANYDVETAQEIEPTLIYRHDLVTGERLVLARPQRPGYIVPQLNLQGTHILYPRKDLHPAGTQIWLVDIEGRDDREILNLGPTVKIEASWFPDGQRVLFLAEAKTHRRLGIWEMRTEKITWLLDDPQRNIEYAFVPDNSSKIVLIEILQARVRASLLDPKTHTEFVLPQIEGNLIPLAPIDPTETEWVGQYYSARQPADLVRFSLDAIHPERFVSLTRIWERTPLRPSDLAPAEDFRWRSVDGLEIQGWLYRARQPKGTIVYIHGGPTAHSEDRFSVQISSSSPKGLTSSIPTIAAAQAWLGVPREDQRRRLGRARARRYPHRDRGAARTWDRSARQGRRDGTSYGGYSSWCAITRWPTDIVAAAAPVCGMTDLVVDYQTTRPDLRPYSEEMLGGSPEQIPQKYYERSPINFVHNIKGKLLIVQGGRDPNVTPENVRAVRAALERAGIPYELLVFEDEGHGISRPANQKTLYLRLVEFFSGAFQ
jgi:dipeptidyl aminopeptidase/acylaminoacyl peptidase